MALITSGIVGEDLEYSVYRMEHAATLGSPVYENSEDPINASDHYCYKIHVKNTSSDTYLYDIQATLRWNVLAHPTEGPIPYPDPTLLNFVEPWPHAAVEINSDEPERSDCVLVLFRNLAPEQEGVSAVGFKIDGMTPPAKFDVHLLRFGFVPAQKQECWVPGQRVTTQEPIFWVEETVD